MGLSEVHRTLVEKYDFKVTKQQYFIDYECMAIGLYTRIAKPIPGIRIYKIFVCAWDKVGYSIFT